MRHYCTYFDSRFLARALALYESLRRHAGAFTLHALCLDDAAHRTLRRLGPANLRPIAMRELEAAMPRLLEAKANRSTVEYYFTCTPALALHVMERGADSAPIDSVTYLDADLYFFADPRPVFDEMARGSVAIIEHRYPPHLQHMADHGTYNVGLVSFRNDRDGRACLRWWHERCLEWCYEKIDRGRFADQGYLDQFPRKFAGVVSVQHRGANAAPWNLAGSNVTWDGGRVRIDGDELLFYHFHRLKALGGGLFDPGLVRYGVEPNAVVTRRIYGPYLAALRALSADIGLGDGGNLRLTHPRNRRELVRQILYGRSLLSAGPITLKIHGEPIARPLLRLREMWLNRTAA